VLIADPANVAANPGALRDELAFAEKKALRTPKNYQVWNHVRLCVGAVGTVEVRRQTASLSIGRDPNQSFARRAVPSTTHAC
jgi:hypothetical protein